MGEVLSAQGKEMGEIKSNLAALSAQMAVMMEEVKKIVLVGIEHHHGVRPQEGGQTGMLPLWGNGTFQE